MDAFLPTYPPKKNSCRMFEREKNILQAHTPRKKKTVLIKGSEKKLKHIPNHPPAPKVKWLAPKGSSFNITREGGRY